MATQWNIGLDIGTANVCMAALGRGVLLRQPAAIALRRGATEPFAYGSEAQALLGRAVGGVEIAFPFRRGALAREDALAFWLKLLFTQADALGIARRPRVLIAQSPSAQSGETRILAAQIMEAGAAMCSTVRSDVAAALGAERDVDKAPATLVADIGAGRATATVLAAGRVLKSASLPFGMDEADARIVRAVRQKHRLDIGPGTAAELRLTLGAAAASPSLSHTVSGLDVQSGFPRARAISAELVRASLRDVVEAICEMTLSVTDGVSPEVAGDLVDGGVLLTGGGAQLYGLDARVAEATGLSCHVADDPSGAVIRGVSRIMEQPDRFESLTQPLQKLFEKRI